MYVRNIEADYGESTKCLNNGSPGPPYMKLNPVDYTSYWYVEGDNVPDFLWNYGAEVYCNLEGQYVTIEADLTGLSAPYEMSICSLGIMGVEYTRSAPFPFSSPVQVNYYEIKVLTLPKI